MKEQGDVIFHTTRTNFSFGDRLKILIGGEVAISSEIPTTNEVVNIIPNATKVTVYVNSRFMNWIATRIWSNRTKAGAIVGAIEEKAAPEPKI